MDDTLDPELEHGIAAELRDLRRGLHLSQSALAALLCVSAPTISRWEGGHQAPAPLVAWMLRQLGLVAVEDAPLLEGLIIAELDRRRFWASVLQRAGQLRDR